MSQKSNHPAGGKLRPSDNSLGTSPVEENEGGQKIDDLLARLGAPSPREDGQQIEDLLASLEIEARSKMAQSLASESPKVTRPRGRPVVIDEELQSKVCLLLSLGLSRRQAASYLDIVHSTIANAMQRDPEFAASVERAEEVSTAAPLVTLALVSRRNWRAAAWLLARHEKREAAAKKKEQP